MSNLRKVELDQVYGIGERSVLETFDSSNSIVLKDILLELKKIELHLSVISGEKIIERDVK